jgi:hypothetical protein
MAGFGRTRNHLEQIATIANDALITPNVLTTLVEP